MADSGGPVPGVRSVGELIGIQYLRGTAAMMVLLYHIPVQLQRMGYDGHWLDGMSSGVDIFYVISGAIMWMTTVNRSDDTPLRFWRRRILRIVPLYWAATGFVTLAMLLLPNILQSSRFDAGHVIASFLFVGHVHPVTQQIEPVLIPGWTLNHEMFFYLLFGLFLLAPARIRLPGMVGLLGLLVIAGELLGFAPNSVGAFYSSSMLLEFALGMALGALASSGAGLAGLRPALGWAMLLVGAVAILLPPDMLDLPRFLERGIPSGLLVTGLLVVETHHGLFRSPLLHGLGNASYSIYLSHMITLSATSQLWRLIGLPTFGIWLLLYALAAVAAGALAGWLLYLSVERPLSRRLHRPGRAQARVVVA